MVCDDPNREPEELLDELDILEPLDEIVAQVPDGPLPTEARVASARRAATSLIIGALIITVATLLLVSMLLPRHNPAPGRPSQPAPAAGTTQTPDFQSKYDPVSFFDKSGDISFNAIEPAILWETDTALANSLATPVKAFAGAKGYVYLLSSGSYDGETLAAVSPRGNLAWQMVCNIPSRLCVRPQGGVFVIDVNKLAAYDDSGAMLWQYQQIGSPELVSLTAEGNIIAAWGRRFPDGHIERMVYVLNDNGVKLWEGGYPIGDEDSRLNRGGREAALVSPRSAAAGYLPDPLSGGLVTCLDKQGKLRWRVDQGRSFAPPVYGSKGTVYVHILPRDHGSKQRLMALDPKTGRETGALQMGSIEYAPAVAPDGTLYLFETRGDATANCLLAVTPELKLKWAAPLYGYAGSSPALCGCGDIYAATPRHLVVVEPNGKARLRVKLESESYARTPVVAGPGNLVYMVIGSKVYGLDGGWIASHAAKL